MSVPTLSIIIPTYNHEKYISEAINSVLLQVTNYDLEILVGEDCSTDGTREVLKKIESMYPERLSVFYREKNMNRDKIINSRDLLLRCKGKYIICLEGDDYWIDPYKIEKQICFLENHPEYYAVAHNCIVVDECSNPTDEKYPECKDDEYTIRHFMSEIMPGQTATFMYRNYYQDKDFDSDYPNKPFGTPGDRVLYYMILANRKRIYCIQEAMSAYRYVTSHGSSYSATLKYDFSIWDKWYKCMKEYTLRVRPEWIKLVNARIILNYVYAIKHHRIGLYFFLRGIFKDKLVLSIPLSIKELFRSRILKSKYWI